MGPRPWEDSACMWFCMCLSLCVQSHIICCICICVCLSTCTASVHMCECMYVWAPVRVSSPLHQAQPVRCRIRGEAKFMEER